MRFHIPTSALQRRSENPVGKPGRKIRSRRSVLTRCRVLSSRSRSIKPISRFFAMRQVESLAALAIRLSKFILQTHVLVSLAPWYYEQWGTTQPKRDYTARRIALSAMLSSFRFPSLQKHCSRVKWDVVVDAADFSVLFFRNTTSRAPYERVL